MAKEGLLFVFAGFLLTFLFLCVGILSATVIFGIITIFVTFFFRDPERNSPTQSNAVLTPADGTILSIQNLDDENNPLGERAVKISIFK